MNDRFKFRVWDTITNTYDYKFPYNNVLYLFYFGNIAPKRIEVKPFIIIILIALLLVAVEPNLLEELPCSKFLLLFLVKGYYSKLPSKETPFVLGRPSHLASIIN